MAHRKEVGVAPGSSSKSARGPMEVGIDTFEKLRLDQARSTSLDTEESAYG